MFLQTVHIENFSQKNRQISMSVFLRFFVCFVVFSGVSQRWEFNGTTKNVLPKNRAEKFLPKKRQKALNRLFVDLF
jgi:hypothetical protein